MKDWSREGRRTVKKTTGGRKKEGREDDWRRDEGRYIEDARKQRTKADAMEDDKRVERKTLKKMKEGG